MFWEVLKNRILVNIDTYNILDLKGLILSGGKKKMISSSDSTALLS